MKNFRILLTGVTSIHGWPIFKRLSTMLPAEQLLGTRPPKAMLPDRSNVKSICITDMSAFENIRKNFVPTHVVHCSGVCDLDVCEERPVWATNINTAGARVIADVFGGSSHIFALSTDLVFSGINPPIAGYSEDDLTNPVSIAGKTFEAAEQIFGSLSRCCTLRLGLPIGPSITGDVGAVDFIEGRFKRGLPLTLFHDEWRSCIRCDTIAHVVIDVLRKEITGLFNLGGDRPWSLLEVGEYAIKKGGYPRNLLTTMSRLEEKNGPPRIGNVSLNSAKIKKLIGRDELF